MLTEKHKEELIVKSAKIRSETVQLIYHGHGGHIGGDLSEVDILVTLFDILKHRPEDPSWEGRDHFILSKGHSSEAYYTILAEYGYIGQKDLDAYGTFGSALGGHPNKKKIGRAHV